MINYTQSSELLDFGISKKTIEIISDNFSLNPDLFDIRDCVKKEIEYKDILLLMQFVYNYSSFMAEKMYGVIVDNIKPTDGIILEPVKKNDNADEDVVDLIVEKYRKAIAQGINSWINVIAKKIQGESSLEDINVADYYDSLTSKQFMNQLEQSILISKLAGMLDTENDEVDFKADGIADWFKQTFAEQLAYFRSKFIFTSQSWKDFKAEQHDVAFTISGLTRGDLLEDAKWLVDKAITNGDDVETFKRQFKRLIGRKGWQADDNRIYTILDTNSRRSYAAGRWQQAMTPEIMQRRPYLVWVHRDSVVPRPNHLALNNKAIRSDHPFWKVAFPTCAFGCRCTAFTANERMLNRMGATILDNPPDPMTVAETGFQRAAGSMPEAEKQEIIDSTLARLSPEIREKVDREVN